MKIIDLCGPIESGMWGYGKPFPEIEIQQIASLEEEGYKAHQINVHSLSGTYLETADHLIANKETIDQVSLDRCIKTAWVAQLEEKRALEPITKDEIEKSLEGIKIKPGDAILISTGWDRMWNKANFATECPYFLPEVMEWFIDKDIGLLGVDIPSVEDPRGNNEDLSQLQSYYATERLLLAPVINLRQAGKGPYKLIALPLNVPGVCATPCRAILVDSL